MTVVDTTRRSDSAGIDPHPLTVPAGYPRGYERRCRLHDGREVVIRPIVPADAAQLREAIQIADADTLRGRFLGGTPRLTPAVLAHLTTLDYVRRFALVAGDARTRHGVAIARYEALDQGVAEVAVVVDPAWRQVGLATTLVEMLAEAALDRGIHTFSAIYQAENRPVAALHHLADSTGRQLIKRGIAEFAVTLNPKQVAAAIQHLDERTEAASSRDTRHGGGSDNRRAGGAAVRSGRAEGGAMRAGACDDCPTRDA
jgi:GNAT superfamily N-acetyltransferase